MQLLKLFFIVLTFFSLALPTFAQSTVGSPRVSSPGAFNFTFQIPVPGAPTTFPLCKTVVVSGKASLSCSGIAQYIGFIYRYLVGFAAVWLIAVSAGTIASSRGSASVTPMPRRNVRRGSAIFVMIMTVVSL